MGSGGIVKKILFLTGTRADFGKISPLIKVVEKHYNLEYIIFATGMHTLERHGLTINEIYKAGFRNNTFVFFNQVQDEPMDLVLANTISGLARYVNEYQPDMIVVHGDRGEALAGAIVGAMRNILVAHIEGGELSGTVDELIRHSVTKLSHIHFVSNQQACSRLIQLGEVPNSIFIIGSPEIDKMLTSDLPTLDEVLTSYSIPNNKFALAILHPVTTEHEHIVRQADIFIYALTKSNLDYLVLYPNNDQGSAQILHAYQKVMGHPRLTFRPSIRFERFLTLLKNCSFIIGNSSVGIRQAPVYGVPSINIGSRQANRYSYESIINSEWNPQSILAAINKALVMPRSKSSRHFGYGESAALFLQALQNEKLWKINPQKQFIDLQGSVEQQTP